MKTNTKYMLIFHHVLITLYSSVLFIYKHDESYYYVLYCDIEQF